MILDGIAQLPLKIKKVRGGQDLILEKEGAMKRILIILALEALALSTIAWGRVEVSSCEQELSEAIKMVKDLRDELRKESKAAIDARRDAEHYYNILTKKGGF